MKHGVLISYHYLCLKSRPSARFKGTNSPRAVLHQIKSIMGGRPLVLDSGAFSAQQIGAHIPLTQFAQYLKTHGDQFEWSASLDVIGDPEKTRKNWLFLRSYANVVPTVHALTPVDVVAWYADQGASRVAFGGFVSDRQTLVQLSSQTSEIRLWLDKAFKVANDVGIPVHGFGVGSPSVVRSYPWDSCDSTTACNYAIFRRPVVADGGKLRAMKPEDVPLAQAKRLFGEFEVRTVRSERAARRARIGANVGAMGEVFNDTTLDTFYHACDPRNLYDVEAIIEGAGGIYHG